MARNPLRNGWSVLARAPESIAAEITWRWVFGVAFWVLLFFSFREYLSQIEISRGEYLLLKSLEPFTWIAVGLRTLGALADGARDMGPILFPALTVLWLGLAIAGRAATVRALSTEPVRTNWVALLQLNVFRVLLTLAALLAWFGAGVLVSGTFNPSRDYGLKVILMVAVLFVLVAIWSAVNWFVSLAQILAASKGEDVFSSVRSAARLYSQQSRAFSRTAFCFAFARTILAVAATLLSLWPLTYADSTGWKPIVVFVAVVSLLYFAAADALYIWRQAVHISLIEPERLQPVAQMLPSGPARVGPEISSEPPEADSPIQPARGIENPELKADG